MKRFKLIKTAAVALIIVFITTIAATAAQTPGPIYQGSGMHFYQIITTDYQELTWEQANAAANSLPDYTPPGTSITLTGHLVAINSQSEQELVLSLPGAVDRLWIGLYQDPLGAEPSGGWSWVTGEALTYTNWDSGEPNNAGGVEEYGEWNYGLWNDNVNAGRAFGYIVEYESQSPITGVDTVGVQGVYIDPIADMQLFQAQLDAGYPVNITGYVGFLTGLNPSNNPTNPKLTSLKLEVEKNASGTWTQIDYLDGFSLASIVLSGRYDLPGREFPAFDPWIISSAGSYTLKVTATFTTDLTAYDTESVAVTLLMPVVVDHPAAPAVAAAILNDEIQHRYDTGQTDSKGRPIYSNYISDVAKMMGSSVNDENGSWFMGIDKADTTNYYNAVYNYLIFLGAPLTPLP